MFGVTVLLAQAVSAALSGFAMAGNALALLNSSSALNIISLGAAVLLLYARSKIVGKRW